jgi:3-oxoacyl-[acyl-carrier protein] reductase
MSHDCALVTGASSDIGMDLVRRLARDGAGRILCHYHTGEARVSQLQDELGSVIVPMRADLSSASSVGELLAMIRKEEVMPTAVVHLPASKVRYERFRKAGLALLENDWRIQVTSLMAILQTCLPRHKPSGDEHPRGSIVLVLSSVTLGIPPKFLSLYTVVKYAQLGLMRALAAEYAEYGVSVNAVSPSMINTPLLSEVPRHVIEMSAAQQPMGRNVSVSDVTAAIAYLLSPSAAFVSGANIPVAGGSAF